MRLNVVGPKAELDKLRPKLESRFEATLKTIFEPKTFIIGLGNVPLKGVFAKYGRGYRLRRKIFDGDCY